MNELKRHEKANEYPKNDKMKKGKREPPTAFHDLWDYWRRHRPLGALIFDFDSAELFERIQEKSQIISEKYYIGKSQNLKNRKCRKRHLPKNP